MQFPERISYVEVQSRQSWRFHWIVFARHHWDFFLQKCWASPKQQCSFYCLSGRKIAMPTNHPLQPAAKCRKTASSDTSKDGRSHHVELCLQNGPQMAPDEMVSLTNYFNRFRQKMKIMQTVVNGLIESNFHKQLQCIVTHKFASVAIPILVDNHWGAIEISNHANQVDVKVTNPNSPKGSQVANALWKVVRTYITCIRIAHVVIPASKGFCGWTLVANWFSNHEIAFPEVSDEQIRALANESLGKEVLWSRVSSCAFSGRYFFSQRNWDEKSNQNIHFGGAEDDEDMSNASKVNPKDTDPWLRYDPWSSSRKQCRWEDLSLPEDHPLHDEKKLRPPQVHRHALNANNHGIAFGTRAMIAELVQKKPKQPFALIVPASDNLNIEPAWGLEASEPKEIIVQDKAVGSVYKRQIVMLHCGRKVTSNCLRQDTKALWPKKRSSSLRYTPILCRRNRCKASLINHWTHWSWGPLTNFRVCPANMQTSMDLKNPVTLLRVTNSCSMQCAKCPKKYVRKSWKCLVDGFYPKGRADHRQLRHCIWSCDRAADLQA